MSRFFPSVPFLKKSLQAWNVLVLALATYDLISSPTDRFSEVGADIVVHALTILSLQENTSAIMTVLGTSANIFRLGNIYTGTLSGSTTISPFFNAIDTTTHLVNAGSVFFGNTL
jgi:hypothetical protein